MNMLFKNYFAEWISPIRLTKGTFLFHQHNASSSLFFIETGLVKAFYETRDGKEFIKSFISEGQIIGSLRALIAREPNSFSAVALENLLAWEIPIAKLQALANTTAGIQQFMNDQILALAMKKERREYELLCLSAEERYRLFCEREPSLSQRLSQADIAAYLGITPVGLSRIHKRVFLSIDQAG